MTKSDYINKFGIERYEELLSYMRNYMRERYHNNKSCRNYHKVYVKEYKKCDLNKSGLTKDNIRNQSRYILFKQRKHNKLKDYEIHHCFGYEEPSKFIYIPKYLHKKIHELLRDNNIMAEQPHYKYIVEILNNCNDYIYISV